jgi:hypothetical protein
MTILHCLANEIYLELPGREHEKVEREPRPVGIGAHLEKNRRTRGLARGNPQQRDAPLAKVSFTTFFNSSLDGNARRAIDIHEGEEVDESAFKALVRQAVALNSSGKSKASKKAKS